MKGKIFTLTVLLILSLTLFYTPLNRTTMLSTTAYLSINTLDPRGPQITVPVGTTVTVYIKISGPPGTSGTLKVEVKKDIVWASDSVKKTLTKSVTLPDSGISDWINMGTFVADELTSGGIGQLREYFIKVFWGSDCIHDPTDPETREWVKTYSAAMTYQAGEFEG